MYGVPISAAVLNTIKLKYSDSSILSGEYDVDHNLLNLFIY